LPVGALPATHLAGFACGIVMPPVTNAARSAAGTGVGVSAAAPIAKPVVPQQQTEEKETQTEFAVILKFAGEKKINVIKEVRAITRLGPKEANDLVEAGGKTVKEGVGKQEADKLEKQLNDQGASVEVK
jgi:large subunit ribosomal protein L7/L12